MYKLTSPEFQNPHPFLTSMTPSGSIPSGPPCSLQTGRLQLRDHPFPKPQTLRMALYNPSRRVTLPSTCTLPTKREKQNGGAELTMYVPCAYQKVENSVCTSAADPSPKPGAPVASAGPLARAPHAELRPLQCASWVIDAGRGPARAMPTVHRRPAAGQVPGHLAAVASRRRCHPPPTHLKIITPTRAVGRKCSFGPGYTTPNADCATALTKC